ncbi:MAG TPA: ribonuclease H-like domain-containing protein [Dehalococcoidia bacterium]|nr:ribonuclease H-like domain-containing protein [Dehalococcoidia bacterium]
MASGASTADRIGWQRSVVAAHTPPPEQRLAPPAELPPIERILGGEWVATAHGDAFVRDEWFALGHEHGNLPLEAVLAASPDALACLAAQPATASPRFGFFDIETTGLGGGTGTYAFLAGLGTFEDTGFRLRQYFLASVAGERAMLSMLRDDLARCDALVTYNGRAFDVPVVTTRLTLARLPDPYAGMAHFDLLHPVRRLYKHRMPACRLADAERRLLGIERFDDIPGALIPALYFAYVRAGRAAPLRSVFRHNADDVLSLVGLLTRLAALFDSDDPPPDDAVALARWWERAGEPERAMALYRAALPWLEGGPDWPWAAQRQARLLRRAGSHSEAAALWRVLWAGGDADAGLALAKHLERRARDYAAAAEVTLALLAGGTPDREGLRVRIERIERKRAKAAGYAGARQVRRTA